MERNGFLALPLALALLASISPAQTTNGQPASDAGTDDTLATARQPYLQAQSNSQDSSSDGRLHGVPPRPIPKNPQLPQPASSANPGLWAPPGNGHHTAIGALIGFGLGAGLGAAVNTDHHTQARLAAPLLFGSIGALIGAAAGGAMPLFRARPHSATSPKPPRYPRPRRGPGPPRRRI